MSHMVQKWKQQPKRIAKRIRERGIGGLFGWFFYQLAWRRRERQLGIDTWEHAYNLDVNGTDGGQYYDPIDYRCIDAILDEMKPDPQRDVFLDYGCGLGRAVIAAAGHPFQRVIGVEVNDELVKYCRRHIDSAREGNKLRCDVELVHQNARTYDVPTDVTRIFMFNAFEEEELLTAVLEKIHQSLQKVPRDLMLVYVPLIRHENRLEHIPWLRRDKELPTAFWDHIRILVYRNGSRTN